MARSRPRRKRPEVTQAELSCLWFEWSRSLDDPTCTCSSRPSGTAPPALSAFDFEYTFDEVIGRDTAGDEVKTIRVVVVELGTTGELGKVQTAYPVP